MQLYAEVKFSNLQISENVSLKKHCTLDLKKYTILIMFKD